MWIVEAELSSAIMHVTMVKKRLASGEPCRKCAQAEQLLKSRGLWNRVDEVLWAIENDPSSPGMQLGARLGIGLAPFFVVHDDRGTEMVYESVLQFADYAARLPPAPDAGAGHQGVDGVGVDDASAAGIGVASVEGAPAGVASAPGLASAASAAGPSAISAAEIDAASRELADSHPSEILRWGLERWGASLGIAFSGAEDVALVHLASESGLPFSVFCLDTGRLHPETYRFIEVVRKRYAIEITLMSPEAVPVQALVKAKGLFSFYDDGHEECCGIRKVEPLRRNLGTLRAWATGQRRDQSPATRSAIAVVETDRTFAGVDGRGTLVKLNPLARWSSADTWQYIRENGIPYNALHERGFVSIGCEPCTRAVLPGEHERAGRWWWEETTKRECGLHIGNVAPPRR